MTKEEKEYYDLVGEEGFRQMSLSLLLLTEGRPTEMTKRLFFVSLSNAFYRGLNAGVAKAQDVVRTAKAAKLNSGAS